MLVNPVQASATQQWATFVCDAHAVALGLQLSFTIADRATANLMAPRENVISTAGNPSSVA
jgi:hypothetical protein